MIHEKNDSSASSYGQAFHAAWQEETSKTHPHTTESGLEWDPDTVSFDDDSILKLLAHIRQQNCDAWILPQPHNLPMGHTREDILVELLD